MVSESMEPGDTSTHKDRKMATLHINSADVLNVRVFTLYYFSDAERSTVASSISA
jgi:hypothetical protein